MPKRDGPRLVNFAELEVGYWADAVNGDPSFADDAGKNGKALLEEMGNLRVDSAADIGCGPHGGVLAQLDHIPVRYFVDPLWAEFADAGIRQLPADALEVTAYAHDYVLPEEVELTICTDALDHVGDLVEGMRGLARNTAIGGTLALILALRTSGPNWYPHLHFSLEDIKAALDVSGFEAIKARVRPKSPWHTIPIYIGFHRKVTQ